MPSETSEVSAPPTQTESGGSGCVEQQLGPVPVPASGGPAGCWMQVLQTAAAQRGCISEVQLRLASGFDASATVYELRAYTLNNGQPGVSNAAMTMTGKRRLYVNAALAGSVQTVSLPQCLPVNAGEYVALATQGGRLGVTVAPDSASSRRYWNIFESTAGAVGSSQSLSSQFVGDLGWSTVVQSSGCSTGATTSEVETTGSGESSAPFETSEVSAPPTQSESGGSGCVEQQLGPVPV